MTVVPPDARPPLPATPYVGLVPYREEDAGFFFGRERETRIVAGNLRASRLTIVYGPSGVGKTSLLQAGVVHDLRERARARVTAEPYHAPFAVCVFRDWRDDPVLGLMDAIRSSVVEARGGGPVPAWRPGEPLVATLDGWTTEVRTLLVVLDQFEDYFLYHGDEDDPGTFGAQLPAVVNEPNLRVNFLLSLREEALAKLDLFKGEIPKLFANYVRVEHLDLEAAHEAIEGPIREWNRRLSPEEERYTLEDELVEAVIDAAAGGGLALARRAAQPESVAADREHVEAPFLQLVMERVWRSTVAAGSRGLTAARLEQLGGAEQIVQNHLLDALGTLTAEEQAVVAGLFRFLVTGSRTKIAHPASDLAEWTRRPEAQVTTVLDKLCRAESGRILRRVPPPTVGGGATRYELFHDVLAEPIIEWRRDYEQESARRAAFRRFAKIGGTLVALVAVFAALGIWALVQRSDARSASRSATSLALASAGRAALGRQPEVALLLGLEANRARPSSEAASTMLDALVQARKSGAETILHTDRGVRATAASPDGATLASGDFGGTIRFWDLRARKPIDAPLRAHTGEIWGLAFSADGRQLASASLDGTLKLWDVEARSEIGQLPVGEAVTSVAWSPTGNTVASGGESGSVRLWDARSRAPLRARLEGHSDRVVGLAFSPDGGMLASSGYDGTVRFWDPRSGSPLGQLPRGHEGGVLSVDFSPDARTLATSGFDETVRLWDVRSRRQIGRPLGANTGEIWGLRFSPDGRLLAIPGFDGTVRLWDVRSRRQIGESLRGHTDRVVSVAFTPDGRTLASSGYDGTVRLWSMPRPPVFGFPLFGHTDQVKSVAFSPDGQLASADYGGTLLLRKVSARERTTQLGNGRDSLETVAWSPDGGTVASAGSAGSISLWDVESGRRFGELRGHEGTVQAVAFNRDGSALVSVGFDGTVRVWDPRDPSLPGRVLRGHEGAIWAVAFRPDGRSVATAGMDETVRLWDIRSGSEVGRLPVGAREAIVSLAFSPDGRMLASGDSGGPVRVWNVTSLEPIGEPLNGHEGRVGSVAFSPDGRVLASASDDGTVRLWDVRGHRPLGQPLRGHVGIVFSVAFSPDGRTLASGGEDKTVRLWEGILWRDVSELEELVCRLVVGNLTEKEWGELVPGLPYRTTCPS
jgi:WD40 repeat protein